VKLVGKSSKIRLKMFVCFFEYFLCVFFLKTVQKFENCPYIYLFVCLFYSFRGAGDRTGTPFVGVGYCKITIFDL